MALDGVFHRTGDVTQRMTSAGLTVVEVVEHPSHRAYALAARPG